MVLMGRMFGCLVKYVHLFYNVDAILAHSCTSQKHFRKMCISSSIDLHPNPRHRKLHYCDR